MSFIRDQLTEVQSKVKLYLSVSRFDAAEKLLKATLADHGPLANMHFLLGLTYHKQSRFPEAIREFRQAIKINPGYTEAALSLAATLCDLSRYEEGQAVFATIKKQVASSRGVPPLILGRIANMHAQNGRAYEEAGMRPEAISEYRKAISLFPRMPDVKLSLAKLYLHASQLEKARQELEETVEIDPTLSDARTLLGIVFYKTGQYSLAAEQWLKAQQTNPNDLTARAYLKVHEVKIATRHP